MECYPYMDDFKGVGEFIRDLFGIGKDFFSSIICKVGGRPVPCASPQTKSSAVKSQEE